MAFTVTFIGLQNYGTINAAPSTISIGSGGVPVGALILALNNESMNAIRTIPNVSDSGGNSYSIAAAAFDGYNTADQQYAKVTTALVSGNTISFQRANGTNWGFGWQAIYVTGFDAGMPIDAGAVNASTGGSATPSVTSGMFSAIGELAIGFVGNYDTVVTYTQPTGGWTHPPNDNGTTAAAMPSTGATLVTTSTSHLVYNPTMSVSSYWSATIIALRYAGQAKPAGWVNSFNEIGYQNYSANVGGGGLGSQPGFIPVPSAIPVGALVCVSVSDATGGTLLSSGAVTDSVGNTYTQIGTQAGSSASGGWWFSIIGTVIPSGGQIRYTRQNTNWGFAMNAFYVMGVLSVSPLDLSSHNSQSVTNISITSGTPIRSGEVFWGGLAGITGAITADLTHGFNQYYGPTGSAAGNCNTYDAVTLNSGNGAVTFAPVDAAAYQTGVMLASFKMAPATAAMLLMFPR